MTQDPFELEMSLLLDGLIEDRAGLIASFDDDFRKAEAFSRLNQVDALLRNAPMVSPPADFLSSVMIGVERVERRRQVHPLLIGLIVLLSLTVTVFFAIPWLVYYFDLYEPLLQIPAVLTLTGFFSQIGASFTWGADWLTDIVRDWFTLLKTEPAAMMVVVGGLAFVSVWIGLREGVKASASQAEGQI